MKTWVALFRGINVGGRNRLPMADLTALVEELEAADVASYIQSGNLVFRHAATAPDELALAIREAVAREHGFEPALLLLSPRAFRAAAEGNPFTEATDHPARLHLGLLESQPPAPDLERLAELAAEDERFRLAGPVFYLHAPAGIGRSKLAANAESAIGVAMTLRNWRTVEAIGGMIGQLEEQG